LREIKKNQRHSKRIRRRTRRRRIRRRKIRTRKGGFWPFTQDPVPVPPDPNNVVLRPPETDVEMNPNPLLENNESKKTCPVCNEKGILDQEFGSTINSVWKTCIDMNGRKNKIVYVTSKNVFIKSIESLQIPEFYIKIQEKIEGEIKEETITCKIMIEDKYVGCFLYVCGEWYAIMRLFGKTINVDFLARTEKNKAFYKLKNIGIDLDIEPLLNSPETPDTVSGSGLVEIKNGTYTKVSPYTWLSNNKTRTIKLNEDCFENINKKSIVNGESVFKIIQRFRQQKILGNAAKYIAVDSFLDYFLYPSDM